MAKRILSAAVALLLVLVLAGCSILNNPSATVFTAQESESFGPYKHYFNTLDDNGKRAYNAILEEIENFPEKIEVPQLSNDELEQVWLALMYDNPELIMFGRECMLSSENRKFWFSCDYAMSKEDYDQKKAELQEKTDSFAAELAKKESAFDKELFIHDTLIDMCEYMSSEDIIYSTPYGVLVNGKASCEGYAKAAKLLLDRAGIENHLICGTAKRGDGESEGHMWNIVYLDGRPYNLDLTWDDPVGEEVSQNRRYAYFNVTDAEILKTHTFSDSAACCVATDYNYFVKLGRQFDAYDANMRSSLAEIFKGHKSGDKIDIRFSTEEVYKQAVKGLFENEEVYRVLSVAAVGKRSFSTKQIKYIADDEHFIIEFILV